MQEARFTYISQSERGACLLSQWVSWFSHTTFPGLYTANIFSRAPATRFPALGTGQMFFLVNPLLLPATCSPALNMTLLNLVHGLFLKGGRGERAREGANVSPRLVPVTCSLASHYRSERNASIWVLCQSLENCILFFRWKRTSAGVMLDGGKKVLEFVAIQRRDNSQWAIPGVSTESFLWQSNSFGRSL